jgi:hypothetical protein
MEVKMWLASIAGGDEEILKQAPRDVLRYAAMGGVIISTALVASLSAALALHMAVRMSWPWAIITGLGWGAIIYNLDRLLVVQMVRQDNKWHSMAIALPRVVLAIILGAVISTPMVLQIFQPEIKTELDVMHAQDISNYDRLLASSKQYALIPVLEKRIPTEQATVDAGVHPDVAADPGVEAAQKAYNNAEAVYEKAEQAVVCEKEGTCGSLKVGAGIAYREKVGIRDDAEQKRNNAYSALQAAENAALLNQRQSQATAVNATAVNLKADKKQLAQLQNSLQLSEQAHSGLATGDSGLLARLEALDRLSNDRPTLKTAHWALFALFLAIELLPVVMKLLQVLGPETDYEKAQAHSSEAAFEDAARQRKHDRALIRSRLRAERKIERDRAKKAVSAGMAGNKILIDTQAEVMTRVLDAWRQYAVARSQEDLLRWQQAHPVPPAVAPDPLPPGLAPDPPQSPAVEATPGTPDEFAPDDVESDGFASDGFASDPDPAREDWTMFGHVDDFDGEPGQQAPPWLPLPLPRQGTTWDGTVPGSYPVTGAGRVANGQGPEPGADTDPAYADPAYEPVTYEPPPPAGPQQYLESGQMTAVDVEGTDQDRRRTQP